MCVVCSENQLGLADFLSGSMPITPCSFYGWLTLPPFNNKLHVLSFPSFFHVQPLVIIQNSCCESIEVNMYNGRVWWDFICTLDLGLFFDSKYQQVVVSSGRKKVMKRYNIKVPEENWIRKFLYSFSWSTVDQFWNLFHKVAFVFIQLLIICTDVRKPSNVMLITYREMVKYLSDGL